MGILDRFSLQGQTALVTGAGRGIGYALAQALAEAGADVACADLDGDSAQRAAQEFAKLGVRTLGIQTDVTRKAEVAAMVAAIVERWGRLDIGVNNAGIARGGPAEELSEEDWDAVLEVNLKAVFLCCQAEARAMLPQGHGKIINTASISGTIVNTPQKQVVYNTTKAGVMHLTKSLAAEWAPQGIRVNSISPGYTRTKLVDDLLATPIGQNMLPHWIARTPQARMAEVTDLQGAVVYLASEASDFMTGHDMIIDGGYCTW